MDFKFGIFLQRLKRLGPYTCISILGFDFRMELVYWNRVMFNIIITYQVLHKRYYDNYVVKFLIKLQLTLKSLNNEPT